MTSLRGLDAVRGVPVEVRFDQVIHLVDDLINPLDDGSFLAPGWVDLQVNGFGGADYNSPTESHEQIAQSLQKQFATGVTRLYPTVITGSAPDMTGALRNLARARASLRFGHAMEAFHVEGPYISPEDGPRGAHPAAHVRPPSYDEFQRFQEAAEGHVRLMTVSPEWPDMPAFIERLVAEGVVVSIGHTKADATQIEACVSAGATMSTHLGNGAHGVMQRHPNYIWDQLAEDRLTASFIVDGIHVGKNFLKSALRAKGIERSVLVTDAVMPAGCQPGPYRLGEVDVELHADQSVRLRGGTRLAGSSLHMQAALGNVMRMAGVSLAEAVTMATKNAARAGRVPGRLRGLSTGERADLVKFRVHKADLSVSIDETYLGGECVYRAAPKATAS